MRAPLACTCSLGSQGVSSAATNEYRLVTYIDYRHRKIFIRTVLNHADYDKGDWKHDEWY